MNDHIFSRMEWIPDDEGEGHVAFIWSWKKQIQQAHSIETYIIKEGFAQIINTARVSNEKIYISRAINESVIFKVNKMVGYTKIRHVWPVLSFKVILN